jgi:hypothetical protein
MIGAEFKKMFFTSRAVMSATDRATRRVLSRFGAFVRRAAKSSIRKRKRASQPGQPPSSHTGLLKKFILFGYDPARRSVVIGPMRLNQKVGDAPEALEHGGTSRVVMGGRRKRRLVRTVRIRPRPFMGPAMKQEETKLPSMWRDSVSK